MDTLTDIELIIQSQSWKKYSKSNFNSPEPRSPIRHMNTDPNIGSSLPLLPQKAQSESLKAPVYYEDNRFRIPTLVKLAVPYKTLTQAMCNSMTHKPESVLIPAFPMRKFGNGVKDSSQPVFERLIGVSSKDKEIFYIKKKSGRGLSNKPRSLPSLFSPRFSKERHIS